MRKTYWIATILVFIWGIALGIVGTIFFGPNFGLGVDTQPKNNAAKVEAPLDLSSPGEDVGIGDFLRDGEQGYTSEQPEQNQEENYSDGELTAAEKEQIISDYKQSLGILFDAWKAKDMPAFRSVLANGYTGELLEKHIAKAEKFIPKGIGLYVEDVVFDEVAVESADKSSATVSAIYRYSVRDYDLDEQYPVGEKFEHFVHVRADLVKINSRWLITGETLI